MALGPYHFTSLIFVLVLVAVVPCSVRAESSQPNSDDSSLLSLAQEEFSNKRYAESLQYYRRYLREKPSDQDAWTRLAAAYYHTGQAKHALTYLRRAKSSSRLRPFSLYYQGLCFDALGYRFRAKRYLNRVVKLDDPLAEDALFELASLEFEDADSLAAQKNAEEYLKRFKEGRFRLQMQGILDHLPLAGKIEIEGTQHGRFRSSYYEQHPLSLFPLPHSWHYQLGYVYERGERSNPAYDEGRPIIRTGIAYEEFKLRATAGLSLGPFRSKNTENYLGYLYEQEWLSDFDRLKVWLDEPADIQYFPFRPDLMERHHRVYFETLSQKGRFTLGAYAHVEVQLAGSQYYPAPERPEIRKSFHIASENFFVPWVDWNYHPQHTARAYTVVRKFIDLEQSDYSSKSYNLLSSNLPPFMSVTVEHRSSFPQLWDASLDGEIFQHQYLFNDFFESYTTRGAALLLRVQPWSFLNLSARAAYAFDTYTYDIIRSQGCDPDAPGPKVPAACERIDKKLNLAFSASYISNKQQAFSFFGHYREHKNDTLKVYDESEFDLLIQFTQAFPTLNQAKRPIEAFRGIANSRGAY